MPSGAATPGCLTCAPSLNAAATAGPQAQHESRSPATCFGRAALTSSTSASTRIAQNSPVAAERRKWQADGPPG